MDELVFQREALRRSLCSFIEQIDKAAEAYDPADDWPSEDVMAVIASLAAGSAARAYGTAVTDRCTMRAEARES